MLKIICLLIFMSSSCITQPLPEIPKPEIPTENNGEITPPKPPVLTKKCQGDNGFLHVPPRDKMAIPSQNYFKHSSKSFTSNRRLVYISYDRRIIKKGFKAGESFIICGKPRAMGNSHISLKRRNRINNYVLAYFKDIGINLELAKKLESENMLEMIVGGQYRDLGCGKNRGILGVAPLDINNKRIDEIGFAFVNKEDSDYMIASTIAHEMAHTFGLDHIKNKCGVMYYAITDYITGFKKGRLDGSFKEQDSPRVLRKNLK